MTIAENPTTEQWIADTREAILKFDLCAAVAAELATKHDAGSINPEADDLFVELERLAAQKAARPKHRNTSTRRRMRRLTNRTNRRNDQAMIAASLAGEEI